MTKTRSRVIQGWRHVSPRPGFAPHRFALRRPRSPSVAPATAPAATDRADEQRWEAEGGHLVNAPMQETLAKVTAEFKK
jgi:hypothetical protein